MLILQLLAIVVCSGGCGGEPNPGFIVLGGEAAASLAGMSPGDTIFELHPADVPAVIAEAASDWAARNSYDPECTRYYGAHQVVVVYLIGFCGSGTVFYDGGEDLVAYDSSGSVRGALSPAQFEDIESIDPPPIGN